jgi:hypothetical protein
MKKHVLVSSPSTGEETKNIAGLHKAEFQQRRGSLSMLLSQRPTMDDLQKMAHNLPAPSQIAASRLTSSSSATGTDGSGSTETKKLFGPDSIPMTVDALLSATKRLEHNTDDDVRMEDVGGSYMWGKNNHGQLGLDSLTDVTTPQVG